MKLHFSLQHRVQWAETIYLLLFVDEAKSEKIEMGCIHENLWRCAIDLPSKLFERISYKYIVKKSGGEEYSEYGKWRKLSLPTTNSEIDITDEFRYKNGDTPFESTCFTDSFFKRDAFTNRRNSTKGTLILNLFAPKISPDKHIALLSNQPQWGGWDGEEKLLLDDTDFPYWTLRLDVDEMQLPMEYKFAVVDKQTEKILSIESGKNRLLSQVAPEKISIVNNAHFSAQVESFKFAGVAIPVFSLRSETDFGIGEFYDLKKMVDWAVATGQKMIQTLPINDTILSHSNYDSYPYNAVSVYALHPVYLNLEAIYKLKDKKRSEYYEKIRKVLNKKSFSDYQKVMDAKWEYFNEIYPEASPAVFASQAYQDFFDENKFWLQPYAVFSYLRDKYGTPEFEKWDSFSIYNQDEVAKLAHPGSKVYDQIAIFYFLQYHLHLQLTEVHDYAREKGVSIKGDIPIGVSPLSADAWENPTLFNANAQAGAPPDDFSVNGQNWGFPTYNWAKMKEDGYLWWKNRFKKFSEYFDAYRIDHILGFFRIWEIPIDDVWGLSGHFNPALPFSEHDLRERGIWTAFDRLTQPYLKEHVIRNVLGEYANDVMREYLEPSGWQSFVFKERYNTQKKIEKYFASLGANFTEKELNIRKGLYQLHCEVLFLRDAHQPEMLHPRISLHNTHSFIDLDKIEQHNISELYIDYFYHRHNEFWKQQAFEKLPAIISSTDLLVCGEDLGMVPDSVPEVMVECEIMSLEIQRMPKRPNTEFAMPQDAPYFSVCTTSTHDMNPIRAWWLEDKNLTQRFYNQALKMYGRAPEKCNTSIAKMIIQQHLESPAMMVVLPWQDWLALDEKLQLENPKAERINVPSDPRNFWCYRMHLTIEQLLKEQQFNQKITELIKKNNR